MARTEHADSSRALFLDNVFELHRHLVKHTVSSDRRGLVILVVFAVRYAQQRSGQPVLTVHDLGGEIALDAVRAPIGLDLRVALRGHHAIVFDGHFNVTTRVTRSIKRLRPLELRRPLVGDKVGGVSRKRNAGHRSGRGDSGLLNEHMARDFHHPFPHA